jgi:hypothetical protein
MPTEDIQSENGVDQNKKYLLEIDHEVHTTDILLRTLSITAPATSSRSFTRNVESMIYNAKF